MRPAALPWAVEPPWSRLAELARQRGIRTGFVLTEPDNDPANALCRGLHGATEAVTVQWDFSFADD